LTWLCSKVDVQRIFGPSPLPLSQYVLLSLIQQLGFDISKDTLLKLTWLREAALVLHLNDPLIAEHVPGILTKLLHNLELHYPKFAADPTNPCSTSFKLLMHVVNSLLK
jgi:enhancer of mRNA-decapping protein 4